MEPSSACFDLIKRFEGCKLTAYQDPGGTWTIGYGHTGLEVKDGMSITQPWAEWYLKQDVKKAASSVYSLTIPLELTQGQLDALVSFVYNLGAGAFESSTLRRLLLNGSPELAADEFLKWVHMKEGDDEVVAQGLLDRRRAERALFLEAS